MVKFFKIYRKIDMFVFVGGKEMYMNNDFNGVLSVVEYLVCIL